MDKTEEFLTFAKLDKELNTVIEAWDAKKL